ncbi:MAG: hypothetical protein ACK4MW_00840 [Aquificaceae bacterium]
MRFDNFKESIRDLQLFNKGWRGLIYKGLWEGIEVAIKVAKAKEKEYAIRKEGEILKLLKGYKGFPQLLMVGENFIVYEFIRGNPIEKLSLSKSQKSLIYLRIIDLIKVLDSQRINKDELQCLDKNTLVDDNFDVYLLDFERGSLDVKKRHNLSQFLQLLVKDGYITREKAIELGKRYAKAEEVYDEVERIIRAFD